MAEFIDTATAAAMLGVTPDHVRFMLRDGQLGDVKKNGRDWLIPAAKVRKLKRRPIGRPLKEKAK